MLPVLTITDFTGRLRVARDDFETENFQEYINRYYEDYLIEFIGAEAFKEIRDVSNPLPEKWNDLLYGVFYKDSRIGEIFKSESLLRIVKQCIFFEYTRDYNLNTNTGFVRNVNENSTQTPPESLTLVGISQYSKSISDFNSSVIPFLNSFNFIKEPITAFSYDGGTGLWTINADCTKYLVNGDAIRIDSIEYTIANLVSNVSFTIEAAIDLVITNQSFTYEPFKIVRTHYQDTVTF